MALQIVDKFEHAGYVLSDYLITAAIEVCASCGDWWDVIPLLNRFKESIKQTQASKRQGKIEKARTTLNSPQKLSIVYGVAIKALSEVLERFSLSDADRRDLVATAEGLWNEARSSRLMHPTLYTSLGRIYKNTNQFKKCLVLLDKMEEDGWVIFIIFTCLLNDISLLLGFIFYNSLHEKEQFFFFFYLTFFFRFLLNAK